MSKIELAEHREELQLALKVVIYEILIFGGIAYIMHLLGA